MTGLWRSKSFWARFSFTLAALTVMMNMQNSVYAQGSEKAVNEPLSYTMTVTGENVFASIEVNGAPIYFHAEPVPLLITLPVTATLQPGRNVVTVDYEPFDREAGTFTPHHGVLLQVKLERRTMLDSQNPFEDSVHLFSGKFEEAERRMIPSREQSVFGQGPLVHQEGGLSAGNVALEDAVISYDDGTSGEHATRVTMEVTIVDPGLQPPPWSGSPALENTPTLLTELVQRYGDIHSVVSANDEASWRREMRLIYAHLAGVLGYANADAMADHVRQLTPLGATEGSILAPLVDGLAEAQLEFGADARLVRLRPDPIYFQTPQGAEAGGYGLFFCRNADRLEVCFMQDIPN